MRAGGAERVVSILIKEFTKVKNLEVHLVLLNNRIEYEIADNVTVNILSDGELKDGVSTYFKINSLAKKYAIYCLDNKIDSSVSFMYKSNYINTRSKKYNPTIKAIVCERSYPSNSYPNKGLKNYIARKLISYFYNKADLVITNSRLSAKDLKNNFDVSSPIVTVYNPFLGKFSGRQLRKPRPYTFINVANLYAYKNQNLIIDSFSKIKDKNSQLIIIGQGEMHQNLEDQIQKLDLMDRVQLLGYQKNPSSFLEQSDCFVLASAHEGFPNVLLEAINCGLSIISSDCKSGPREILAPQSNIEVELSNDIEIAEYGILVPVGKITELVEAMEMVMINKDLVSEYRDKSEERIKEFDSSKISKRFLEHITDV